LAGIEVSNGTVTWNSLAFATIQTAVRPSRIDLLLNASASPASLSALLQAVTYASTADAPPATRTVKVAFAVANFMTPVLAQRTVAITAVNDAPSASPTVLTVAGQTATGRWTAVDPEGDVVTWSVLVYPANGTLTLIDPATGAWTFAPNSTNAGSATVRATDGHAYADFVVPVLVSGPADPRPAPASDPPLSAQVGTTWTWELAVAGDIASSPSLELEAIGAPAGLTISAPAGRNATLTWPVPAGATVGSNVRFHLRISDRSSGRSALVPVLIHLRALIGGGG
jgi:hypothetical protein